MITNDELISILENSLPGATATEEKHLQRTIRRISLSQSSCSPDSPSSLKLKNIVAAHSDILSPEIIKTFEACEIYCVEEPICNAYATRKNGGKIIVFEGLLQVISFYINLIKISDLFNLCKPEKQNEAVDFLTAGFALLVDFIETGETLPKVENVLPPKVENDVNIGFLTSVLFLLNHEAAHLMLGHTKLNYHSELNVGSLRLEENAGNDKKLEFEADEYAFFAIDESLRDFFIPSIVFFLGAIAFAETFSASDTKTHPLAANRIARLADFVRFENDPQARKAVFDVIEGELDRHRRLFDYRNAYGSFGRSRIQTIMPTAEAKKIFDRFLTEIKSKNYFSELESGI
ncbi:MAG: M48 family metalloprotease [Pyrinomonadaceae bacterium]|nr:M48 family metalloprotease [Pyrinomonadaceae bacterium]